MTSYELKIWEQGYKAFHNGKVQTSNPYDENSTEFIAWFRGWYDAQYHPMIIKEYNKQTPHVRVR